jgi:hypothetical protein
VALQNGIDFPGAAELDDGHAVAEFGGALGAAALGGAMVTEAPPEDGVAAEEGLAEALAGGAVGVDLLAGPGAAEGALEESPVADAPGEVEPDEGVGVVDVEMGKAGIAAVEDPTCGGTFERVR